MSSYDIFFWLIIFFLGGVALGSIFSDFILICFLAALLGAVLAFWGLRQEKKIFFVFAVLPIFIVPGAGYAIAREKELEKGFVFGEEIQTEGWVASDPDKTLKFQEFAFRLGKEDRILVRTSRYPEFEYGDRLSFSGVIEKPDSPYLKYLHARGLKGISSFPELHFVSSSFSLKKFLYSLKGRMTNILQRTLPVQEAAFLSGLLFGEKAEFEPDFKEAMNASGTTHLVALSGYNVSVITKAINRSFGYFLSGWFSSVLSVLAVVLFVAMTGVQPSIVRAAVMGILIVLSGSLSRTYDFRNAVAFTALVMVLANPLVLVFDVGFQLSFAALLGLVYLSPVLEKLFFRKNKQGGFLNWKSNLVNVFAAQVAVLPILFLNFGYFSLSSFAANVLILEAVPLTMLAGFAAGVSGFVFFPLAALCSWFAFLFLKYETFLIRFFSGLSLPFEIRISWEFVFAYYTILVILIFLFNRLERKVVLEY